MLETHFSSLSGFGLSVRQAKTQNKNLTISTMQIKKLNKQLIIN